MGGRGWTERSEGNPCALSPVSVTLSGGSFRGFTRTSLQPPPPCRRNTTNQTVFIRLTALGGRGWTERSEGNPCALSSVSVALSGGSFGGFA